VDTETIWQAVRRFPSAGLAEFALRIHNELHRRATADELRRAEGFTPNKGSKVIIPSAVVLHHSDGSYRGGVAWISNPASKVSYHVLIARDGRRTVFCNDTERAWHAGKSNWQGRSDLNSWSLGVAWEGNTYEYPLGNAAIDSALEYLLPRLKKWNISRDMVLDHRLVSPGRKTDLAPAQYNKFQERLWAALAAN
jgi:N-acetyl-anhydromuramyl-L-alanine amidase AmpD